MCCRDTLFNPTNPLGSKTHFLQKNKDKTPLNMIISFFNVKFADDSSQVGFNSRINDFICYQNNIQYLSTHHKSMLEIQD